MYHIHGPVKTDRCEHMRYWQGKHDLAQNYLQCLKNACFALSDTGQHFLYVWMMQDKQKSMFSKNISMFTLIFKYTSRWTGAMAHDAILNSPHTVAVPNTKPYFAVQLNHQDTFLSRNFSVLFFLLKKLIYYFD